MSAPPSRPAPAPAGPEAEGPRSADYEFADRDKDSFRELAASVSFVGVCTMLFGVLSCTFFAGALYAGFASSAFATAGIGALSLVTAWWMVSAGRSLSALVRTRGRDVEDLMEAVTQFRRLFGLARVVIVLVAVMAVAGGAFIVWCTVVLDRGGKCFNPWG
jgi:hypothetical protein